MIDRRALLLGVMIASAGTTPALAQPADRARLRDTLMELEIASWQLVKDKSIAGMQGYMADESFLIFFDGTRLSKADFLKLMPDFRLDSFTVDKASADVLTVAPDVAALMYRITYTASIKGAKPETATVQASNVYVRRDGKWWSALYQETQTK